MLVRYKDHTRTIHHQPDRLFISLTNGQQIKALLLYYIIQRHLPIGVILRASGSRERFDSK
jgi:hypothetical protein